MSDQTLVLTPELYRYLKQFGVREHPVLKELREETHTMTGAGMQISPEAGQFMALLMELMHAKKTLDIGTFTGYSSLVVALALPDDGQVVTFDISTECTEVAKRYWQKAGCANKIKLRLGNAVDELEELIKSGEANNFDFSFIDADKNNYDVYYEKSLVLLRSGGLIMVDNVLWDGAVIDKNITDKRTVAIRELNEKIYHDNRVTIAMLPVGDGLMLARKK